MCDADRLESSTCPLDKPNDPDLEDFIYVRYVKPDTDLNLLGLF